MCRSCRRKTWKIFRIFLTLRVKLKKPMAERVLSNTSVETTRAATSDLEAFGDGNLFKLVSKKSSKSRGTMQSVKFMRTGPTSGVLQITLQQRREPVEEIAIIQDSNAVGGVRHGVATLRGRWKVQEHLLPVEGVRLADDGSLQLCSTTSRKRRRGVNPAAHVAHESEPEDLVKVGDQELFLCLSAAS